MQRLLIACVAACAVTAACGPAPTSPTPVSTPQPPVVEPTPTPTPMPTPPVPTMPAGPTLSVSRILCFGDSLTVGFVSQTTSVLMAVVDEAYPTRLQLLLNTGYPSQSIVVDNAGVYGEWADDGKERIVATVRAARPDVVVLMEGANDINGAGEKGVGLALDGLENMLRDARALGAKVFLASIPPQRSGGRLAAEPNLVLELNEGIRSLSARQQVTFVDVHRAFGGDLSLIGPDGLHPTAAGYQRIADTVFQALKSAFERQ